MPEKKENRRVQYTKNALRTAFLDLITEKPLQSITVTDICARADINRSTFYLHYQDVHSLLEEIEDDILRNLHQRLIELPFTSESFAAALTHIKANRRMIDIFHALLSNQGDPQFMHRMQALAYEAWAHHLPHVDGQLKPLVFSFVVTGVISALASWMQSSGQSAMDAEQVVALLETLIQQGVDGLPA